MSPITQIPFAVDHDGLTLRGMAYLPADTEQPQPTVLLLHGFTGQRMEAGFLFVQLGRALADTGIAAVTFDFRHSGESDGSFDQMLTTGELEDALLMTSWLKGQPFCDAQRMGLMGFSLGGLVAACTVGAVSDYRALVLLAPTTVANVDRFAVDFECEDRYIKGPHTLHPQFFNDVATLDPLGACVKNPRPTLLIAGEKDEVVSADVSNEYVEAMRERDIPLETLKIDGAGHIFDTPETRAALIDANTDFFSRQLLSTEASK